ncbi:unnamed protein product [Moneuplotes crassus]|uniref:Uncharacterized protein n=1 Tax=Euplotes crassus TaxID=5936 RepID=A0AAD1UKK5_EUPCR|nr:unnamed protein product [Moneuplotes crassus]
MIILKGKVILGEKVTEKKEQKEKRDCRDGGEEQKETLPIPSTLNSSSLLLNKQLSLQPLSTPIEQEECKTKLQEFGNEFIPFKVLKMAEMKEHLCRKWERQERVNPDGSVKKKKGRKRTNVLKFTNLYELIHEHVIPRWKKYLSKKSIKTDKNSDEQPRSDILWKKIIRDAREFYRILFRMRFHYLDHKDEKSIEKCISIFFEELGIPIEPHYFEDPSLYIFLHQTKRKTESRLFSDSDNEVWLSPFKVIEKFNSHYKKFFLSDKLCSRLLYFVYINYITDYTKLTNLKYQTTLVTTICLMLRCYTRMSKFSQLSRVNLITI